MFRIVFGVGLAALSLMEPARAAESVDVADLGRLPIRAFTDRDGLPQNSINAIAVDRRRYLWVGTGYGAAYYNGRKWTVVHMPSRERSNTVRSMITTKDGSIWFGTDAGVHQYLGGRFVASFDKRSGLPVDGVLSLLETEDKDGQRVLWAGIDGGRGSLRAGKMDLARHEEHSSARCCRVPSRDDRRRRREDALDRHRERRPRALPERSRAGLRPALGLPERRRLQSPRDAGGRRHADALGRYGRRRARALRERPLEDARRALGPSPRGRALALRPHDAEGHSHALGRDVRRRARPPRAGRVDDVRRAGGASEQRGDDAHRDARGGRRLRPVDRHVRRGRFADPRRPRHDVGREERPAQQPRPLRHRDDRSRRHALDLGGDVRWRARPLPQRTLDGAGHEIGPAEQPDPERRRDRRVGRPAVHLGGDVRRRRRAARGRKREGRGQGGLPSGPSERRGLDAARDAGRGRRTDALGRHHARDRAPGS